MKLVIAKPAIICQRASRTRETRPFSSLINIELIAMQSADATASDSEMNRIAPTP
jgi:hypothetical protein